MPTNRLRSQTGNASMLLLIGTVLLIVIGLIFLLKSSSPSPLPPIELPQTEPQSTSIPGVQIIKSQEVVGELLPGLPTNFPINQEAEVVSSYVGTAGDDSGRAAYGAVWQISEVTVFKVMEWYSEEMAETWIFDSPPDEDNTSIQMLKAHLKDGQSVSLTVAQPDGKTEVSVKADFIL